MSKVLLSVFRVTKGSTRGCQEMFKMHLGMLDLQGWMSRKKFQR